jgi:hypothetical protein
VKFLPKKYSIGSGIVIDRNGGRSNQIDVVIYDSHFHPELFSQGSGYLYPVDVVYMVIEIKTTMNKDKMKEAIENIRSVKRLDFINSEVLSLSGRHLEIQPTSPPLGVIFGFKFDTQNFETFESWIKPNLQMSKREVFDLCYLLKSTFYHAFPELDLKNEITRGIFPIDIEKVEVPAGSKEFKNPDDNRTYPIVQLNDLSCAVDPSRGFLNFLKYILDMLLLKHVIQSSILNEYMPGYLTKTVNTTSSTFWSSEI